MAYGHHSTAQHSTVQWHALWSWYDLTHTVALPTEFWVLDSVDWPVGNQGSSVSQLGLEWMMHTKQNQLIALTLIIFNLLIPWMKNNDVLIQSLNIFFLLLVHPFELSIIYTQQYNI